MPEYTHVEVAEIAGKGLRAPSTLTREEIKSVCASALRQAGYESSMTDLRKLAKRNKTKVAKGKMTAAEAIDDLVNFMAD